MRRISVFLTEPQIKALKQEAIRLGLRESELIRRAVDLLISKRPKPKGTKS